MWCSCLRSQHVWRCVVPQEESRRGHWHTCFPHLSPSSTFPIGLALPSLTLPSKILFRFVLFLLLFSIISFFHPDNLSFIHQSFQSPATASNIYPACHAQPLRLVVRRDHCCDLWRQYRCRHYCLSSHLLHSSQRRSLPRRRDSIWFQG